VVAGSYITLGVEVSANGAEALFFVNGVNVATITTNIPTGTGRGTAITYRMNKTAGTTNREAYVDSYLLRTIR
jgi:hypothetical protein